MTHRNQRYIIQKFNSPCSPWMGGAMEPMAKIEKTSLKSIMRDWIFTDEALSTFLKEAESLISIGPLIAACDEFNDLELITPHHLLIGKSSPNYKPCVF